MFENVITDFDNTRNRISHILASQGKVEDAGGGLFTVLIRKNVYNRVRKMASNLLGHDDEVMAQIAQVLFFEFNYNGSGITVYIGDIITANEINNLVAIDALDSLIDAEIRLKMLDSKYDKIDMIVTRSSLLKFR